MNEQRTRVLFFDDESLILKAVQRQCRRIRPAWDAHFAESGYAALDMLEEWQVDVIISDMRMPGMTGAEFLATARERWPATHRMILSGQTDQSSLLEGVGAVHRFLQKPCDMKQIIYSIEQSLQLRKEMCDSQLNTYITKLESLPVINSVYRDLMTALDDPNVSIDSIADIVSRDAGLSVKVLQLVNSAFYCIPRRIDSIVDAVRRIGLSNLQSLALIANIFRTLDNDNEWNTVLSQLWAACIDTGACAEQYAKLHNQPPCVCSEARIGGMLSLIGRVILVAFQPEKAKELLNIGERDSIPLLDAEQKVCGIRQQVVGAYSLGIWAFDERLIDAVLHQYNPANASVYDLTHPAVYVHAARATIRTHRLTDDVNVDIESLASIGFDVELFEQLKHAA